MAVKLEKTGFTYEFYFRIGNGPIHNFDECTEAELNEVKERIGDRFAHALGYKPTEYIYYDPNDKEMKNLERFK